MRATRSPRTTVHPGAGVLLVALFAVKGGQVVRNVRTETAGSR
jgi:hypothetical protein